MCLLKKLPPAVPLTDRADIAIHKDRNTVEIDATDVRVYKVSTGSMKPLLGKGTYAFFTIRVNIDDLVTGQDLVFEDDEVYPLGTWVLHRIIEIGQDEDGWWCRTRGLNNSRPDKGKRREHEVRGRFIGMWNG